MSRNAFMLKGKLRKKGYDWWWHSLTAHDKITGEAQPFFIEYYVVNPGLMEEKPVYGQLGDKKPAYAMLKAGAWGEAALQVHNFFGAPDFSASFKKLDVRIGEAHLTEKSLKGRVALSSEEAKAHPEYMSDPGEIAWDLKVTKKLAYNVGYGASPFFRFINAFSMFWHIEGMLAEYEGTITLNGREYKVTPEKSFGYQDKNWGRDYTSPWIWLNCNNFKSLKTGEQLSLTSLDIGGGRPVVFGIPFMKKILAAFYYKGEFQEYNFSKFWRKGKQLFDCPIEGEYVNWNVEMENAKTRVELKFRCLKKEMLLVNYENPMGEKKHNQLWNGGNARGTLRFFRKQKGDWVLEDELEGANGGCEYGEYGKQHYIDGSI